MSLTFCAVCPAQNESNVDIYIVIRRVNPSIYVLEASPDYYYFIMSENNVQKTSMELLFNSLSDNKKNRYRDNLMVYEPPYSDSIKKILPPISNITNYKLLPYYFTINGQEGSYYLIFHLYGKAVYRRYSISELYNQRLSEQIKYRGGDDKIPWSNSHFNYFDIYFMTNYSIKQLTRKKDIKDKKVRRNYIKDVVKINKW